MMEVVTRDKQVVMRTLSDGELIRIVRAQPGQFHPDDVAGAQAEVERRRLTPLLEKLAMQDVERRAPMTNQSEGTPSWHIAAAAIGIQILKDVFSNWLEISLSYTLAIVLVWTVIYWLEPRARQKLGFWKWLSFVLVAGVGFYLFSKLVHFIWPSAVRAS